MAARQVTIQRQGRIYRFLVNGTEYVAFIWQDGTRFCGRVEGQSHIPQCTAKTALLVRDALQERVSSLLEA